MGPQKNARFRTLVVTLCAICILVPSMLGFVAKFAEFINTFRSDAGGGAFAITPITNYLLATFGFFCLFVWATLNGMFFDIEKPKHLMLEQEAGLDNPTTTPQAEVQ